MVRQQECRVTLRHGALLGSDDLHMTIIVVPDKQLPLAVPGAWIGARVIFSPTYILWSCMPFERLVNRGGVFLSSRRER